MMTSVYPGPGGVVKENDPLRWSGVPAGCVSSPKGPHWYETDFPLTSLIVTVLFELDAPGAGYRMAEAFLDQNAMNPPPLGGAEEFSCTEWELTARTDGIRSVDVNARISENATTPDV